MVKCAQESDGHPRPTVCLGVNVNNAAQWRPKGNELRSVRGACLIEMHYRGVSRRVQGCRYCSQSDSYGIDAQGGAAFSNAPKKKKKAIMRRSSLLLNLSRNKSEPTVNMSS